MDRGAWQAATKATQHACRHRYLRNPVEALRPGGQGAQISRANSDCGVGCSEPDLRWFCTRLPGVGTEVCAAQLLNVSVT